VSLFNLLEQSARRFPQKGAVYRGTTLVHRYSELCSRALRLATSLLGGAEPGARVAIATENCPEYLELLFGAWAAGMVVVPINYKLHPREMAQIVEDSGAAWLIGSVDLKDGLTATVRGACRHVTIGSKAYSALFKRAEAAPVSSAPESLAWLFFTSGTTGRSKGAMLSHRNLMTMTLAHLVDVESLDENSSQVHAAPMSHGSGLYIPAYVARAGRQVVPESGGFDPQEFIDLCCAHPACGSFLAPTMVQRLRVEAERRDTRPTGLRTIVYGGGPMYLEELKKSLKVFGQVFVQIYGQGEAPMTITSLRRKDHEVQDESVLGSVGWARTGMEVAVVDSEGARVPPETVGEIVCRGDVVMSGYWNNTKGTAEAIRGGWLYTGDMGSMDERGYLTLRDRSKDVVISGGSNIYPREVEEALLSHPAVAEVCVVGQADDEWGEAVIAFVVRVAASNVAPEELDRHCLERIARFKRPKQYHFIDALPKNSYGKVLKRELKDRLASGRDSTEKHT